MMSASSFTAASTMLRSWQLPTDLHTSYMANLALGMVPSAWPWEHLTRFIFDTQEPVAVAATWVSCLTRSLGVNSPYTNFYQRSSL